MEDKRLTLNDITKGIIGISKSTLGVNIAPLDIINNRLEICKECVKCVKIKNVVAGESLKCRECGCLLKHKTRLNNEICPLGKW